MSTQAKLLSALLRRVAKPRPGSPSTADVHALRASVQNASAPVPLPPSVEIHPVDAGGVRAEWVSVPSSRAERVLLYLHGGYYVSGSPRTHRNLTWRLAEAAQAKVLVVDYRLAPEHPYPAAREDVLKAHRWLVEQGVTRLAWAGDSAGGGLSFSALRAAHVAGLPMPRAVVALSPWTDLAGAGRSWIQNAERDAMLSIESLHHAAALYRGQRAADDPELSPAYATFDAAPSTLIQVGDEEILLDDAHAVAARLRAAGAEVELHVWREVPHVWQVFAPLLPESSEAIAQAGAFLSRQLSR